VQGVFYRANTRTVATRLGLSGWVRNCSDATVEAVVAGSDLAVEELISWCRQGPPAAKVLRVEVSPWLADEELPGGFDVRF